MGGRYQGAEKVLAPAAQDPNGKISQETGLISRRSLGNSATEWRRGRSHASDSDAHRVITTFCTVYLCSGVPAKLDPSTQTCRLRRWRRYKKVCRWGKLLSITSRRWYRWHTYTQVRPPRRVGLLHDPHQRLLATAGSSPHNRGAHIHYHADKLQAVDLGGGTAEQQCLLLLCSPHAGQGLRNMVHGANKQTHAHRSEALEATNCSGDTEGCGL